MHSPMQQQYAAKAAHGGAQRVGEKESSLHDLFYILTQEEQKMEWSLLFFLNSALLGVGLSMDAFSVSLADGLHEPDMTRKK